MDAKDITRLPDPRSSVTVEIHEVIHELHGRPHAFLRVKLGGWYFPHRAGEPFLVIKNVVSRFVLIDRDATSASAYFDRRLPRAHQMSFGYDNIIVWDFPLEIDTRKLERLDRLRLASDVIDPLNRRHQ